MRATAGLLILIVLVACSSAAPAPPLAQALDESSPTHSPQPSPSPQPSATPLATATTRPTATALPSATATATPTAVSSATSTLSTIELSTQMFDTLNQRRDAERCPALELEPRLTQAAQAHAEEIMRRREVSHRSADGSTLEQRLERVGYPFVRRSETIAVGINETVDAVVDRWMDEPLDGPHRSSIMNCLYQHVGIGVAATEQGVLYWVVDYGQPQP